MSLMHNRCTCPNIDKYMYSALHTTPTYPKTSTNPISGSFLGGLTAAQIYATRDSTKLHQMIAYIWICVRYCVHSVYRTRIPFESLNLCHYKTFAILYRQSVGKSFEVALRCVCYIHILWNLHSIHRSACRWMCDQTYSIGTHTYVYIYIFHMILVYVECSSRALQIIPKLQHQKHIEIVSVSLVLGTIRLMVETLAIWFASRNFPEYTRVWRVYDAMTARNRGGNGSIRKSQMYYIVEFQTLTIYSETHKYIRICETTHPHTW